jgi:hypothetical protein
MTTRCDVVTTQRLSGQILVRIAQPRWYRESAGQKTDSKLALEAVIRTIPTLRSMMARAALVLVVATTLSGTAIALSAQPAVAAVSTGQSIVNAAASQSPYPYCEGGGGIHGPTVGNGPGSTFINPDGGTASLQPGDVVFFGGTSLDGYYHSGIYAGNDLVWDALEPGDNVAEHSFATLLSDYGNVYQGAARYSAGSPPPPSLAVTTTSLPNGTVWARTDRVTYSENLAANGGNSPYKWSMVSGSGSLPPGLRLRAKGTISGRATTAGRFTFTVKVLDKKTKTRPPTQDVATRSLSITINPTP